MNTQNKINKILEEEIKEQCTINPSFYIIEEEKEREKIKNMSLSYKLNNGIISKKEFIAELNKINKQIKRRLEKEQW